MGVIIVNFQLNIKQTDSIEIKREHRKKINDAVVIIPICELYAQWCSFDIRIS